MKRRRTLHNRHDDGFTRSDAILVAGLGGLLIAALMLTFTPQVVYRALHRHGYSLVKALLESDATNSRTVTIRLTDSGETLRIRRSNLDGALPKVPFKVWFNPAARLEGGIVWFDERVLDPRAHPTLTTGTEALIAISINLVLGAFGLRAILSGGQDQGAA